MSTTEDIMNRRFLPDKHCYIHDHKEANSLSWNHNIAVTRWQIMKHKHSESGILRTIDCDRFLFWQAGNGQPTMREINITVLTVTQRAVWDIVYYNSKKREEARLSFTQWRLQTTLSFHTEHVPKLDMSEFLAALFWCLIRRWHLFIRRRRTSRSCQSYHVEYKRQKGFILGASKELSKINFCPSKRQQLAGSTVKENKRWLFMPAI